MHEETRRRLLRAGFVLFCLIPTAGVLGWTLVRALPLQTRRLEHQLYEHLGLRVQIGQISYPRPHQLSLTRVKLLDPESHETLVEFPRIDANDSSQGWRMVANQATLPPAALPRLWQTVHQRLMRQDETALLVAQFSIREIELADNVHPLTLYGVNWSRGRRPDVQTSRLMFATSDGPAEEAVKIEIQRDRTTGSAPVTRAVIDTGTASLPMSLFATMLGTELSTEARVQGRLPLVWQPRGWQAEFVGQLSQVNLAELPTTWIPRKMQGMATLNIQKCAFDERGLRIMRGWLNVDQWEVDPALIGSLIEIGLFSEGPAYAAAAAKNRFTASQFGVSFSLGEMGLNCKGVPDDAGLPVAATGESGPVLLSDAHLYVHWLVQALVPEDVENVYEARARLMRTLPATLPGPRR